MRSLTRRLEAVEAANPPRPAGRPLDLSVLSNADLEQLEGIMVRNHEVPMDDWPVADLRFLASIRIPVDAEC